MKATNIFLFLVLFFQLNLFSQIDSLLFESIKTNNIEKVDSFIESGISLDQKDENGAGILMWACYYADSLMVALLFDKGVKHLASGGIYHNSSVILEEPIQSWYGNPQAVAAGNGDANLLKHLLFVEKISIDETVNHPLKDSLSGWTPLMYAVYNERPNTIKILLDQGADIQKKNKIGQNAINITNNILLKKVLKNRDFELLAGFDQYQKWNFEMMKYYRAGDNKTAIELAEKNLKQVERIYGKDHPVYGTVLNDLGGICLANGLIGKALPLNLEAVDNAIKTIGKDHLQYGLRCNNLARVYVAIGDKEKALTQYEAALMNFEKSLGKDHSYYGRLLSNVAELYGEMEEYQKAIELYIESKENIGKNYGIAHPQYALVLNNIGAVYIKNKEYDKALPLFLEAKKITEKALGAEHTFNGISLNNLAHLYMKKGDYDASLNAYLEALEIKEKKLGKQHPKYGFQLANISYLCEKMKDYDQAAFYNKALITNASHTINNSFQNIPSKDQYAWKKKYIKNQSFTNSFFYNHRKESIPDELVNYNLQLKGLITGNETKISSLSHLESYGDWLALKQKIGAELSKPVVLMNSDIDQWQKEAYRLEAILLKDNNFRNQYSKVSVKDLQEKLKPNEAIIDFIDFDLYNLDLVDSTRLYVAYIIPPQEKAIQLIPLFTEKELYRLIKKGTQNKSNEQLYAQVDRGLTPGKKKNKGQRLSTIWEQLLPHLEDYTKLYISQTGLLNKINLGAIAIGKDTLAWDRFDLAYHNNLRSFISSDATKKTDAPFLLVGGVDYDLESQRANQLVLRGATSNKEPAIFTKKESWKYLPEAEKEVMEISKLLKKNTIDHTLLMKEKATESMIKEIMTQPISPRVVHVSTHGFFYAGLKEKQNENNIFKEAENPLIRSGLILSGANYAWQNGNIAPGESEDGILTAYEVSGLNLAQTELVVLSACETGLGDIRDAEGVIGLQKAFKIAGAKYVIMSLWQVPDEATQELMTTFYNNWLEQKMDIRTAFDEAQKSIQADYDDPYFWAGFVLVE